ncbi:flagellar motor control protein ZomB [Nocardia sp. NPDC050406]|uniref:flagellar motor control protein ZomB n=1 Tax=Nocardia sp. NPDC050406 TaxID=3364318 RepID=UPI00378BAAB3
MAVEGRSSRLVLMVGIAFTAVLFGLGGWDRRWIADDGLTVLRTVRNLLAGNGPVFNVGERVEVNTSTGWTYLIWFFSWLTGVRLEYVVLSLALALSITAVVFAMLGAARLWGRESLMVPAGVLVYIALPPARDYATSGLESGLVICWLAVLWWLMVGWGSVEKPRTAGVYGVAFVAGLAPLIRPELTVLGALALLMIFCAPVSGNDVRPWLFRARLLLAAGLIPVGYQVWRMGYYGLPYPNTAVAKDAGEAKWRQGLVYFWNLVGPYWLWVPLVALAVAALVTVRARWGVGSDTNLFAGQRVRRWRSALRSPAAVVALMLVSAALLTGYEIRVGGDFMHGRMLLPPLFCALLPVMVIPLKPIGVQSNNRRNPGRIVVAAALAVTAVWALCAAQTTAITTGNRITASGIADERGYYIQTTGRQHPIRAEDYLDYPRLRPMLRLVTRNPSGGLVINTPSFTDWYLVPPPDGGAGHTVYYVNLGMMGMNTPLDVRVLDPMGLAYPLAAHTLRFPNARIGHDKNLDSDWVVVDSGMLDQFPWLPWFLGQDWGNRIHTALTCPQTQDLLASTRAPLTTARFLRNLQHSPNYARYRIDRVPENEIARCQLTEPA